MIKETSDLAWKMVCELRSEIREAQKIKTQVIGFKIAFVTATFGFVFGAKGDPNERLLLLPAFASVFFDYLIVSFSFSIKRIGFYCREYLEPKLRMSTNWPDDEPLWEEAMSLPEMRQHFANIGNLGITTLAVALAAIFVFDQAYGVNRPLLGLLLILLVLDFYFSHGYRYTPEKRLQWPVKRQKEQAGNPEGQSSAGPN